MDEKEEENGSFDFGGKPKGSALEVNGSFDDGGEPKCCCLAVKGSLVCWGKMLLVLAECCGCCGC